jgi:hypothetical protein
VSEVRERREGRRGGRHKHPPTQTQRERGRERGRKGEGEERERKRAALPVVVSQYSLLTVQSINSTVY